jgi:hypothetical protein
MSFGTSLVRLFFCSEMGWQWSLIIIGGVTPTDDTIARKVNTSDASAFAKICGCFPSQGTLIIAPFLPAWHVLTAERFFSKVWGVIWLVIAFIFFLLGIMVGILAFKVRHHPKYAVLLLSFTLLTVACDCCVAIGGPAREGCRALLARARV